MKKILAIAVATAIAAPAMADMTIGGTIIAGYSNTEASTSGYGIDTAALKISGSTTTDNGLAIAGSMSVGGLQRGDEIGGEDASMSISGDFGTVAMSSVEAGNGVFDWSAVGPAENMSGELLDKSMLDMLSYTAPKFGNFTVKAGISHTADGVGAGDEDAFDPDFNLAYASGAVSAFANYKVCASDSTCDNRVRFGVKYDAGVAVVAAAYGDNNAVDSTKDSVDMSAGVSVPMGATTLGLNWASTELDNTTGGARDAYSVGVSHNLGGGVSLAAKYTNWDDTTATDTSKSSVLMSFAF